MFVTCFVDSSDQANRQLLGKTVGNLNHQLEAEDD